MLRNPSAGVGNDEIVVLLAPLALTNERVEGLLRLGLSGVRRRATVGGRRTIRRWRLGESKPPWGDCLRALDDLRCTALILLKDGRVPREHARSWLLAANDATGKRPVDLLLAGRPEGLFAAASAHAVLFVDGVETDHPSGTDLHAAGILSLATVLDPVGRSLSPRDPGYRTIEVAFRGISDEILRRTVNRPDLMRDLHWRDFEMLVADLFVATGSRSHSPQEAGTRVSTSSAARRTGLGMLLYVVECKRYVSPGAGSRPTTGMGRRASSSNWRRFSVTTSRFTPAAIQEQTEYAFPYDPRRLCRSAPVAARKPHLLTVSPPGCRPLDPGATIPASGRRLAFACA